MKFLKSSAPMVIINSVSTKAPNIGETSRASDMMTRVKSYSIKRSRKVKLIKKGRMLRPNMSVYENSSLTMRKRVIMMHVIKK